MTKVNMTAREDAEQATLMSWAAMQTGKYPELAMLFHIPNGGRRNAAEAARFKAEGVKAGVPDLFLPVARCGKHGLWIEMKRREGGRVSEHQSEWIQQLREQGYGVEVCYGWEEASKVLLGYMSGGYTPSVSCADSSLGDGAKAGGASPSPTGVGAHKAKGRTKKHGFDFDAWMEEN